MFHDVWSYSERNLKLIIRDLRVPTCTISYEESVMLFVISYSREDRLCFLLSLTHEKIGYAFCYLLLTRNLLCFLLSLTHKKIGYAFCYLLLTRRSVMLFVISYLRGIYYAFCYLLLTRRSVMLFVISYSREDRLCFLLSLTHEKIGYAFW